MEEQGHSFIKESADWTLIGSVKNNPRMKIPVIGNGDIDGPSESKGDVQQVWGGWYYDRTGNGRQTMDLS